MLRADIQARMPHLIHLPGIDCWSYCFELAHQRLASARKSRANAAEFDNLEPEAATAVPVVA